MRADRNDHLLAFRSLTLARHVLQKVNLTPFHCFGEVAQPIYYSTQGAGDGPDVDSVPLPVFASTMLHDGGELRFNEAGALENFPAQPLSNPSDVTTAELLEAAWQADHGAR